MDKSAYKLVFIPERNLLEIDAAVPPDAQLLETFARYDDALDAIGDLRALCKDGATLRDAVEETYGKA